MSLSTRPVFSDQNNFVFLNIIFNSLQMLNINALYVLLAVVMLNINNNNN